MPLVPLNLSRLAEIVEPIVAGLEAIGRGELGLESEDRMVVNLQRAWALLDAPSSFDIAAQPFELLRRLCSTVRLLGTVPGTIEQGRASRLATRLKDEMGDLTASLSEPPRVEFQQSVCPIEDGRTSLATETEEPKATPADNKQHRSGRPPKWGRLLKFESEFKLDNAGATDEEVCAAYRKRFAAETNKRGGKPVPANLRAARAYRKQQNKKLAAENGMENPT